MQLDRNTGRHASQIALSGLRLILQWPLLQPADAGFPGEQAMKQAGWAPVADPLDIPGTVSDPKIDTRAHQALNALQGYSEQVYFHDFVQRFLHFRGDNAPLSLWQRTDRPFTGIEVDVPDHGTHRFDIVRHTLHHFRTARIAVLTVELVWAERDRGLTLDVAQTAIDLIRRSYVPYWGTDTSPILPKAVAADHPDIAAQAEPAAPRCTPGRVPDAVRLFRQQDDGDARETCVSPGNGHIAPPREKRLNADELAALSPADLTAYVQAQLSDRLASVEDMRKALGDFAFRRDQARRMREPTIFDHWRQLTSPLHVGSGPDQWRDPSDERIPLLSFVDVAIPAGLNERAAMQQIAPSDWIRLVDAEVADSAGGAEAPRMPYNPDFLASRTEGYFYDRFMAHDLMPGYMGTRHLFGGAHYGVVGAGGFHTGTGQGHFRRHYTQLALIARLEVSALLAFSARLTDMVVDLDGANRNEAARQMFDDRLRALQEDFLSFTHRFRFTGVSSQIQPSEMFDKFRASLDLDRLYADVKQEIQSALEFSATLRAERGAEQAEREARAATRLTQLATLGLPAGLALAAFAVTLPHHDVLPTEVPELSRLGLLIALFYLSVLGANWVLARFAEGRQFEDLTMGEKLTNGLLFIMFVAGLVLVMLGWGLPADPVPPQTTQ